MRQVPSSQAGEPVTHLLIGNGRLARHLARYLSLAEIPHDVWLDARSLTPELLRKAEAADRVWILVSDDAIASVSERLRALLAERGSSATLLHASGATVVPGVRGVHPLMTFGPELYDFETYRRVPFVIEDLSDGATPAEILGGLPNVALFLDPAKRALYHALVSVSGNFPSLLWADAFERFERDLGLPRDLLAPYLFRTLANVISRGESALTGPLVRGDRDTIRAHHRALEGTPLEPLYSAFEDFVADRPASPLREGTGEKEGPHGH
jgi:predicted short-subunit dehydrogenase-like oxidoreductase (DUF2520 family)